MSVLSCSLANTSKMSRRFSLSLQAGLAGPRKLQAPKGFCPPTPRPMMITDGNYLGFVTGALAAASRFGTGVFVLGWTPFDCKKGPWPGTLGLLRDGSTVLSECSRPTTNIIFYDDEASPQCRKVREACSLLDLTVVYRPLQQGGRGWGDDLPMTAGMKATPYMIDGDVKMHNADEIVGYLFEKCESLPYYSPVLPPVRCCALGLTPDLQMDPVEPLSHGR